MCDESTSWPTRQGIEEAYQWTLQGIRATKRNEQPQKADAFLLRDVTTTLLDCGLRPEEVFRLKPENIRDGAIWIYRGKRKGSRRRVRMTERVRNMLDMWLSRFSGNSWLFPAATLSSHIESLHISSRRRSYGHENHHAIRPPK